MQIESILIALAFISDCAQDKPDPEVSIEIVSDRRVFLEGEPVELTVLVSNPTSRTVVMPRLNFARLSGEWDSLLVSEDGQAFHSLPERQPEARRSTTRLMPGQGAGYPVPLGDFVSLKRGTQIWVKAAIDFGDGELERIVFDNGERRTITESLSFSGSIESAPISIEIKAPSEPIDMQAFDYLVAQDARAVGFAEAPFAGTPYFGPTIRANAEYLNQTYRDSQYAVHARRHLCRQEFAELLAPTVIEEGQHRLTGVIIGHDLETYEDDLLYEAIKRLESISGIAPIVLNSLESRLGTQCAGSAMERRARLEGLLD